MPRNLYLTLRKRCACHEFCTWPCESDAPAINFALDLAKVLHLPRILNLTLRKCCACHEFCTWPCESAATATNSALDLTKALRLPQNLHLTVRKCCACHEICTRPCESAAPATKCLLDLAKMLRLPRNLHPTLPKCCACPCDSNPAKPLRCHANGPGAERDPRPLRDRSEHAPTRRCGQASFRISGDADSRTGPRFLRLSHLRKRRFTHRAMFFATFCRAMFFARGLIPSFVIYLRELAFN